MAKEAAVEVAKSTTVQVIETLCDKIGPVIKQVAESLGTSSEHVMIIFTKQVYADVVENFLCIAICGGIAFAWYKFSKFWFDRVENHDWDSDGEVINTVISVIIYIIIAVLASVSLITGIKMLINPEYYAFTAVLSKVTELIPK